MTGTVKDATGSYQVPMFIVGGFMLLSAVLVFAISARDKQAAPDRNSVLEPTANLK